MVAVDGVRVKRWIEIDEIDACIGELLPIRKPFQIVAEIQPIHSGTNSKRFDSFVARLSRSYLCCATVHVARPTRSILDFGRNDKTSLGMTSGEGAGCRSYLLDGAA